MKRMARLFANCSNGWKGMGEWSFLCTCCSYGGGLFARLLNMDYMYLLWRCQLCTNGAVRSGRSNVMVWTDSSSNDFCGSYFLPVFLFVCIAGDGAFSSIEFVSFFQHRFIQLQLRGFWERWYILRLTHSQVIRNPTMLVLMTFERAHTCISYNTVHKSSQLDQFGQQSQT